MAPCIATEALKDDFLIHKGGIDPEESSQEREILREAMRRFTRRGQQCTASARKSVRYVTQGKGSGQQMDVCRATKLDGSSCSLPAWGNSKLCWSHSPENAAKRCSIARRGGRARGAKVPSRVMDDLEAVAEQLQNVAEMTLAGDLDPDRAKAVTNALQAKQGSLRLLREWYVVDVIGERLSALEGSP